MQQNLLFQCFLIAQHVSSDTPLTIRSSKTVIAASGFTYVCGCRQLNPLHTRTSFIYSCKLRAILQPRSVCQRYFFPSRFWLSYLFLHENTVRPLGSSRFYHTNKIRCTVNDILQTANPSVLAAQDVYRQPLNCWDRGVRIPLMSWKFVTFFCYTLCTKRPLRRANHSFKEVLLCVRVCLILCEL